VHGKAKAKKKYTEKDRIREAMAFLEKMRSEQKGGFLLSEF